MFKKLLAEIFCIFECLLTQNSTNQDSSRPCGRLSRELFLPENDFQTSSIHKIFQKIIQILEASEPIEDMKFRLEFFSHALLHMLSISQSNS